jgi:hypothetical protein
MSTDPTTSVATTDEHDEQPGPDTAARVLGWRLEQLCAAGYGGDAALALALDSQVDLHFAVSLLRRGCPPETAWRILS